MSLRDSVRLSSRTSGGPLGRAAITTFDPVRLGRHENAARVGYYLRDWRLVLRSALGMVSGGFGLRRVVWVRLDARRGRARRWRSRCVEPVARTAGPIHRDLHGGSSPTVEITVGGFGCRHDRILTALGETTDQPTPARHGAHRICGLLTGTAIAADTLHRITLADA